MGLVPGNRILLRGGNSPMMAACLLGALKAGLVAVPTMPLLRAGELAQIIDKAQVSAALCDSLLADELQHCMTPGHASHMASTSRWKCMVPLGLPVVPLVKAIRHTSSRLVACGV